MMRFHSPKEDGATSSSARTGGIVGARTKRVWPTGYTHSGTTSHWLLPLAPQFTLRAIWAVLEPSLVPCSLTSLERTNMLHGTDSSSREEPNQKAKERRVRIIETGVCPAEGKYETDACGDGDQREDQASGEGATQGIDAAA